MFLYALNHMVGFDAWTMEEIKGYGSAKVDGFKTICHGHPEVEVPGVEVTTGPLGQGIANAVGLAIASKNLRARFNLPNHNVIQSHIYCVTGDGCLMEGVASNRFHLPDIFNWITSSSYTTTTRLLVMDRSAGSTQKASMKR